MGLMRVSKGHMQNSMLKIWHNLVLCTNFNFKRVVEVGTFGDAETPVSHVLCSAECVCLSWRSLEI